MSIWPALCEETLRLGRILAELTPGESEVHGLVALVEIQTSRPRVPIRLGRIFVECIRRNSMRMMVRVTIPADAGSAGIKSGKLPQIIGETIARHKPEAAYFTADGGNRTAYFFIDLKDQSDMPSIAEPFFSEMNAEVDFQPVMTADDLKKGLAQLK